VVYLSWMVKICLVMKVCSLVLKVICSDWELIDNWLKGSVLIRRLSVLLRLGLWILLMILHT
jgi:hypothetical protein